MAFLRQRVDSARTPAPSKTGASPGAASEETPERRDEPVPDATKPDSLAAPVACVADDDVEMRGLIGTALRGIGFSVREHGDGATLVEYLRGSACPAIVITDLQMPGFTGMRVIRYIRRLGLKVPVVLVTAFGHPSVHMEAIRAGAAAVLDKPFSLATLCTLTRSLVETT